jgi:exodeoxyribonuclease VII small subunit
MSELEEIVHVLEDSRLPLEELVEKYERGAQLLETCQQRLNAAQQRIELITRRGNGPPVLEPLPAAGDPSDSPDSAAAASPPPAKPARSRTSSPDYVHSDEIRLF